MYKKEKKYCLVGALATIPALIFAPVAIVAVWIFVVACCISYRRTLDHNFDVVGMKIFGPDPLANPDMHVYLRSRLKNPVFRDAFFDGLSEDAKDRYPWLRKYEPKK